MTEPLSDTLARLRDLRERARARYAVISVDAELAALEHNTGPARDAMLERAREIIRRFQDDPYWEHTYEGGADDMANAWLAEYEGAGDE